MLSLVRRTAVRCKKQDGTERDSLVAAASSTGCESKSMELAGSLAETPESPAGNPGVGLAGNPGAGLAGNPGVGLAGKPGVGLAEQAERAEPPVAGLAVARESPTLRVHVSKSKRKTQDFYDFFGCRVFLQANFLFDIFDSFLTFF